MVYCQNKCLSNNWHCQKRSKSASAVKVLLKIVYGKQRFSNLEMAKYRNKGLSSMALEERSAVTFCEAEHFIIFTAVLLTAVREVGAAMLWEQFPDNGFSIHVATGHVQGLTTVRTANHRVLGHRATARRNPLAAVAWQSRHAGFDQSLRRGSQVRFHVHGFTIQVAFASNHKCNVCMLRPVDVGLVGLSMRITQRIYDWLIKTLAYLHFPKNVCWPHKSDEWFDHGMDSNAILCTHQPLNEKSLRMKNQFSANICDILKEFKAWKTIYRV